jgi:hypothetical protein
MSGAHAPWTLIFNIMDPKETLKLLETKYVTVGDNKIPIKLTFRAMIDYEKITGESVQFASGTEKVTILFYCAAKAGAKSVNIPFDYDYEKFLDYIDDHPESLLHFYESLMDGQPPVEEKKKKASRS